MLKYHIYDLGLGMQDDAIFPTNSELIKRFDDTFNVVEEFSEV
jgi:hypothetical protein